MKTYNINGKDFVLYPNMTVERYGDLTDYFDKMLDEKGHVSLDLIREFTKDSKKMTELVNLALTYQGKAPFKARIIGKKATKLKDLKHITLEQFIDVIVDFFGLGGPLQKSFLTALSQVGKSAQMPSTNIQQKS